MPFPSARRLWLLLLLLPLALCLGVMLGTGPRLSHDCALELQCAQLLLDGQRPYVDFYKINPPLIIYLNTLPVLLARGTGLSLAVSFTLLVGLAAALTLGLVFYLLARRELGLTDEQRYLLTLIAALLVALAAGPDWGQREHLFLIGYLPFLLRRVQRWEGLGETRWGLDLAVGIGAGLVAALKPHFLLIAALPELFWALRRRTLRPWATVEMGAFVAVVALYVLHFLFWPAAMRAESVRALDPADCPGLSRLRRAVADAALQ